MSDRSAAISVIETFNGHTLPGSNVPLQVRFADSLAQKRLKGQTARKRVWRARDFQPMTGFTARPMQMPMTPETMLGFASTTPGTTQSGGNSVYMSQAKYVYKNTHCEHIKAIVTKSYFLTSLPVLHNTQILSSLIMATMTI
jgi:hypothetical protein